MFGIRCASLLLYRYIIVKRWQKLFVFDVLLELFFYVLTFTVIVRLQDFTENALFRA